MPSGHGPTSLREDLRRRPRILHDLAVRVRDQMSQVDGVVDPAAQQQAEIPTFVCASIGGGLEGGLDTGTVAASPRPHGLRHTAGQVLEGQIAFPPSPLRVDLHASVEDIGSTRTQRLTGPRCCRPVASIQRDRGPNFVMRENAQRRLVVQCNVTGRDLRSVIGDVQRRVGQNVRLPQGYRIEYGGQFESEAQASRRLLWLSIAVVITIFFIVHRIRLDA